MVQEVLLNISLIIVLASVLTILARVIKQPAIIAYLVAGILAGPIFFNLVGSSADSAGLIQNLARIGVAFLLFIVGLHLDFRLLKEIGKVSILAGIAEVILVGLAGFLVAGQLGFSNLNSFYIGLTIAFSSTVVVVKILSDKKEMNTLHGRISLGILIIQDILAALAIMLLPFINSSSTDLISFAYSFGEAIILIIFVFIISAFVFNRFLNYLAKSQEALFLFGIAWALLLATAFFKLGFSMEIGALIAGISLASSKYALEISGKIVPIRDFFVVLFFIFFGSQLAGPLNSKIIFISIILSFFVIIVKPLIIMVIMKFFGYTKKTNFLVSISLAQISEFSLIILLLGFSLGHLSQEIMNIAVIVALITISLSTYFINYSNFFCKRLLHLFNFFEGKNGKKEGMQEKSYDIILFGYHRIGYKLLKTLKKTGDSFAVVDYNPRVVNSLITEGVECIYGDAGNKNLLNEIDFKNTKIVLSTIPDEESNLTILEVLKEKKSKAAFIGTAEQPRIALDLYEAGADYVIIPHHLGGEYSSKLIEDFGINKEKYKKIGKNHFKELNRARNNSSFE
jgi:Kef-type K+ transport system membrane component KefB